MKKRALTLLTILLVAAGLAALIKALMPRSVLHQGRSVDEWSRLLNSPYPQEREQATAAIRDLGARAVPRLTKLLSARESLFQKAFFSVAPKLPARVTQSLWRIIRPVDWVNQRAMAARALGLIGPDARAAIPALGRSLRDRERSVCWETSAALGRLGKESVPTLIAALRDPATDVRHAAAVALGMIGPEADAAIPALIETLQDKDNAIRYSSAYALGQIGRAALPPLLDQFTRRTGAGRLAVAEALIQVKPAARELIPPLLETLSYNDAAVRKKAIELLGGTRPWQKEVLAALVKSLADAEPEVRVAVLKVLGQNPWKAATAVPTITRLLDDADPSVRAAATNALQQIEQKSVIRSP